MVVDHNQIIDTILEKEGGYVNHNDDRGGETNFGITKVTAQHHGYDGDMKDLPESIARVIYHSTYISKPNFTLISEVDENLGEMVILFGVHAGTSRASKTLQRLLNVLNCKEHWFSDLKVDGRVGPKTAQALKEFIDLRGLTGRKVIAEAYKSLAVAFYIELSEKDESQETFTWGWLLRVLYG